MWTRQERKCCLVTQRCAAWLRSCRRDCYSILGPLWGSSACRLGKEILLVANFGQCTIKLTISLSMYLSCIVALYISIYMYIYIYIYVFIHRSIYVISICPSIHSAVERNVTEHFGSISGPLWDTSVRTGRKEIYKWPMRR